MFPMLQCCNAGDKCIECLIQKKPQKSTKLCKVISFENKLLNKPKSAYLQKTTLKEGAGTKIIIWQYHPLPPCSSCLDCQEEDVQQGGQSSSASLSSPVTSAAGVSSRLALPAGTSHSGQVPLHNTSPSWASPPHLTLNKHPLHYPSLHKTEKVRYIQASLGITLPSQSRSSGH